MNNVGKSTSGIVVASWARKSPGHVFIAAVDAVLHAENGVKGATATDTHRTIFKLKRQTATNRFSTVCIAYTISSQAKDAATPRERRARDGDGLAIDRLLDTVHGGSGRVENFGLVELQRLYFRS